jgi:hypothetical protein
MVRTYNLRSIMELFNRIIKLRPKVKQADFDLQDNSDGNGPFISRWDSPETKPTDAEIDSIDDSRPAIDTLKLSMQETDNGIPRYLEDHITDGHDGDAGNEFLQVKYDAKIKLREERP